MKDDDLYDPDGNMSLDYSDIIGGDAVILNDAFSVAPSYTFNTAQHINFYDGATEETVNIGEHGIRMSGDADLTIEGKSMKEFMQVMEERLLILQDDFEKHEMYPALKDAYEKYKLIEKLMRVKK